MAVGIPRFIGVATNIQGLAFTISLRPLSAFVLGQKEEEQCCEWDGKKGVFNLEEEHTS